MQYRQDSSRVTVLEAVDMLADMIEWGRDTSSAKETALDHERLKEAFRSVLHYMQQVATTEGLQESTVCQGLHAIMALIKHSLQQGEKVQGLGTISALTEFKNLEAFYQQKIFPHLSKEIREMDITQQVEEGVRSSGDILQDVETVRKDKYYELFLIQKEAKKGYFTKDLLSYIYWIAHFDALLLRFMGDQPFTKLATLSDRDCQERAKSALKDSGALIDSYYKEALKFKQSQFVSSVNKALMALMLAADPRNLITNASIKTALDYYQDFQFYLRKAFASAEYRKLQQARQSRSEHFLNTVMQLSLQLCSSFFLASTSKKEEISLIRNLMKTGKELGGIKISHEDNCLFQDQLIDQDTYLRSYFNHYPNGPILKAARMIERNTLLQGFDPLGQGSYPSLVYTLTSDSLDLSVLRLPSPLIQEIIDKAALAEEFQGWIESMKSNGNHHLLINLQDRTSWKEYTRSVCLENLDQTQALSVVTLAKSTEFYHQSGPYKEGENTVDFIQLCEDQVLGEGSGFYFPAAIKGELTDFIPSCLKMIHAIFFKKKEVLSFQNRLDFIEIFYLFLILKLVETLQVDSLSFVSKDAVDEGAALNGQFFALMKLFQGKGKLLAEDEDCLLGMLYVPALTLRGRVVDSMCFKRLVSSLAVVSEAIRTNPTAVIEGFSTLYSIPFFKQIVIRDR